MRRCRPALRLVRRLHRVFDGAALAQGMAHRDQAHPEAARQLSQVASQVAEGFDADGYKILCRPLLTQSVEILAL